LTFLCEQGYFHLVGKNYDPNALLYRWIYREEDNLQRLVGTDPALADRSKFFRWINEPDGWERREPWPAGTTNVETLDNAAGVLSAWPGAVPLPAKRGRPPKEEVAEDDRVVTLSLSVRRAELYEIQRHASDARKTVTEWLGATVRAELGRLQSKRP